MARQSYLPFGETWGVSATSLPTDYTFTGQREAAEIGLMYYVARWYDTEIGHFVQADTIVPGEGNPLAWNRYAYVLYNPMVNIDPFGHTPGNTFNGPVDDYDDLYELVGDYSEIEARSIHAAVRMTANQLGQLTGLNALKAFSLVYGVVTFESKNPFDYYGTEVTSGAATLSSQHIMIATMTSNREPAEIRGTSHMIHELGHAFASTWIGKGSYGALGTAMANDPLLRRGTTAGESYGFASGYNYFIYQVAKSNAESPNEVFADMFVGYVTNEWYRGSSNPMYFNDNYQTISINALQMSNAKSSWISNYMVNLFGNNFSTSPGDMR